MTRTTILALRFVVVFALVLAVLLFVAGREMFGTTAGLIAMVLYVFDPTVLANAPFGALTA